MHEESRKDQNKNKKELLDYVGKSRNEFREHTQTHPNRVYLITVIRKSSLCTPKKKKREKKKEKKEREDITCIFQKFLLLPERQLKHEVSTYQYFNFTLLMLFTSMICK